ncbi:MAG: radical SAM/SPASM domain-containing protein [Deltaproteobacteria bacterium]|nr:radical SAM/SPASM domain-containing protein [Deltaproteobacteria bacterium]
MPWPFLTSICLPRWDWLQVEVTSFCNASCVYCPHSVYQGHWASRHMSLATFAQLLQSLGRTRLVHLQGWGEPLLNPDFFNMVAMAKQAGCQVGTTTNGMLLDFENLVRLVGSGIDFVAFSLAGTDEKNDVFRRGTSLKRVLENIQTLRRVKEKMGASGPEIHIAYLVLRSGMADLARLPKVIQGFGVKQVVISTLDFVPQRELEGETVKPDNTQEYEDFIAHLKEIAEMGRSYGLNVHHQLKEGSERRLICPENVQRALFVGADGSVSPCAFANLPVSQAIYVAKGAERPYLRLILGNLHELPLSAIWRQKAYANFRRSFFTGKLISLCQSCLKM